MDDRHRDRGAQKTVERLAIFLLHHDRSDVRGPRESVGALLEMLDREIATERTLEAIDREQGVDDGQTRFEQAIEEAEQLIDALGLTASFASRPNA